MTRPTFKIIITDGTYNCHEYLRKGFRRYEFAGLSCIASHRELHIYRTYPNTDLVPKFDLSTLKPFEVEIVTMSKDEYIHHTELRLKGLYVSKPNDDERPSVVAVISDDMEYKFIYLEGYAGEVLKGTHFQDIADHHDLTKNNPHVIFSVEYVDPILTNIKRPTHSALNSLIDAVCTGEGCHVDPTMRPAFWFGKDNTCIITDWCITFGKVRYTTPTSHVKNAIKILETIRETRPGVGMDETIDLLNLHL